MTSPDRKQAFLVADDEPANRTLFEIMLSRTFPQATLFFAEHGQEALGQIPDLIEEYPDLVVISDIQMGGLELDGPALIKNIRKSSDPRIAQLRVLLNSAQTGSEAQIMKRIDEQAGEEFEYEFLKKPMHLDVFKATLLRMLAG